MLSTTFKRCGFTDSPICLCNSTHRLRVLIVDSRFFTKLGLSAFMVMHEETDALARAKVEFA